MYDASRKTSSTRRKLNDAGVLNKITKEVFIRILNDVCKSCETNIIFSLLALFPYKKSFLTQFRVCEQVYATGYGHGGRLGLGGTETVTSVRLIESLQHAVIRKVAVHSGGKHAMALSMDGDVYSWGEGDDGKLGHGSRK